MLLSIHDIQCCFKRLSCEEHAGCTKSYQICYYQDWSALCGTSRTKRSCVEYHPRAVEHLLENRMPDFLDKYKYHSVYIRSLPLI